jgi:hypothetical protein
MQNADRSVDARSDVAMADFRDWRRLAGRSPESYIHVHQLNSLLRTTAILATAENAEFCGRSGFRIRPFRGLDRLQVKDADQPNDDEVDRHDKVEQARHDQNENAGDQRD